MNGNTLRKIDISFIIAGILFFAYFLFRLIDQSKIIFYFPFEYINDVSGYIAILHFFDTYGFMANVSNWYNGFILFSGYPPGFFFFAEPFLLIFKNFGLTFFILLIFLYIVGFFVINAIGKAINLDIKKRLFLFCFYFFNPILISHFVRMMRLPALFSVIIMLILILILFYFKDRDLSYKFIALFSFFYSILVISHPPEFILFNFLLLGFFLIKSNKDKIKIIYASLIGLLMSSFWLVRFIYYSTKNYILVDYSVQLSEFSVFYLSAQLTNFILPAALVILFFMYIKNKEDKLNDMLFFGPVVLLAFLHFFRLTLFIPVIGKIYSAPYTAFFTFFIVLFLIKIDFKYFKFRSVVPYFIISGSVLFIISGFIFTERFLVPSDVDYRIVDVLGNINERYTFLGDF